MEDNRGRNEEVYTVRIKAGKRTYFFDVKETKGNDFYVTITESKKKEDGLGYDKHKIFLYKEDFGKFIGGLTEVISHVKNNLMPDFDFDRFAHEKGWHGEKESKLEKIENTVSELGKVEEFQSEEVSEEDQ
jgi:hypothetical protein